MGMMSDLLGTLPSATIHKDPERSLVLRMDAPNATTWQVGEDDDTLEIQVGNSAAEIDLTPLTLSGLRTALSALGLSGGEVIEWNGSATLLVPGQSGQTPSGGPVHLYGFTNPLWAVIRPYDRALRTARASGDAHAEQLILTATRQYWVDFWGSYFGVRRRDGEQDAPYIARIIAEVFRPRNTKRAIEMGVLESLGWDVYIKEPWRQIFTLSKSRMSGFHRFQGDYYRYHIIHPLSEQKVDWGLVEEQIHRLRPAGTLMWDPNNWGAPGQIDLHLPTDLIGDTHGLIQEWMDLSAGRLSRDLIFSSDYYFLRVTEAQSIGHHAGGTVRIFYADSGDPAWDEETWTSYGATTWREKSSVSAPIFGQHSHRSDPIEEFHAMAVIAGDEFWKTRFYFPPLLSSEELNSIYRKEIHAAVLSYGADDFINGGEVLWLANNPSPLPSVDDVLDVAALHAAALSF